MFAKAGGDLPQVLGAPYWPGIYNPISLIVNNSLPLLLKESETKYQQGLLK